MVKKITILVSLLLSQLGNAQMAMNYSEAPMFDYNVIDVQPQYPGGFKEFLNYVQKNFKPDAEGVSGTVKVDFIIDVNGFISSVKVKNDVGDVGKSLAKVLEKCPKWDAGEEEGQRARVVYHDFSIKINN
jgi:periplasmic protein TonB